MSKVYQFPENDKGVDYFVGDIHGCLPLLKSALYEIGFDEKRDRLFSVGDLVDRGIESLETLRFFNRNDWFHAVRGNHEQMLIDMHNGHWSPDNYAMNGGVWYFNATPEERLEAYEIVMQMPHVIQVGDIGVVHAQPKKNWNEMLSDIQVSDEYTENYILWGRDVIRGQLPFTCEGIGKVFCGHTVVKESVNRGNVKFIDTGAVFYNVLTICDSSGKIIVGK